MIDARWVRGLDREEMGITLLEYRFFVERFTSWLAFAVARTPHEEIRQLLLPNLVEECGELGGTPSHLSLLDACLRSCGVSVDSEYSPLPSTTAAERWFYRLLSEGDPFCGLAALGPGTEAISEEFLIPLEKGLRKTFSDRRVDYRYFDAHRAEVEGGHAEDLERALKVYVSRAETPTEKARLRALRREWVEKAQEAHASFWDSLRVALGKLSQERADAGTSRLPE